MTALIAADRDRIARARELAELSGADAVRELTGDEDIGMAYAVAFGRAQFHLRDLLAIIERPGGEAEDARRLAAIRDLLHHFDWEHHDRQYALEAIERIADGGRA